MVIPDGWSDVTDDLPAGTPCTLARPDGIGALQFSRAHYRGGVVPEITVEDLESLLEAFAKSRGLAAPVIKRGMGRHAFVWCDLHSGGELVRVWYVSDGRDVAMVSYVAEVLEGVQLAREIQDATDILMSVELQ